jgi:CPA1 family monovalent cation:H+ antiporter
LRLAHAGQRELVVEAIEENQARHQAIMAARERLDQLIRERELSEEITRPLRTTHDDRLRRLQIKANRDNQSVARLEDEIELLLIQAERDRVNGLYRKGKLKDESRRRIERELDLREAHLTNGRSS